MNEINTQKKIRVVFGINNFGVGGAERMTARLISHLDPARFECTLVTLLKNPDRNLFSELPPAITIRQFTFSNLASIRSWFGLYRYLKSYQPDIVVSSLFFGNTVFRLLKPFVGYVSIAREHNTYVDKPHWQRVIDRLLSHQSYLILAVSNTVADFTAQQQGLPRDRFTVIRNGIDTDACTAALASLPGKEVLKKELGFQSSDTVLLNIARLVPQKGHSLLLDGFALHHRAHPACKLAIVGDWELRDTLEAQATSLGLSEAVRFFGYRSDVWKFYKIADFFVSASVIEGMSNTYLEAFAAGVPLVATLTAGTDELLVEGKNGFIIRERTPEAVSEALSCAISSDHTRLSIQAKETAARFSLTRTVTAYEALFEEAVRQVPSRP